ncbi:MAG TPA: hypothetical protein VIX42_01870, partial [Edaphobacter sp.]
MSLCLSSWGFFAFVHSLNLPSGRESTPFINECQIANALTEILRNSPFWLHYRQYGMYGPPPYCKRKDEEDRIWSARMYPAFVGVAISWPEWNALRS